jgi:uncharacterized membrane protein
VNNDEPSRWTEAGADLQTQSLARLATIVYALQALSLLTSGLALFAGMIINYVRRDDVRGTWLESHFRWQIRTFWFTLLWTLVGIATLVVMVGWGILFAVTLWLIYRIVKGWLYLYEKRPMPR